MNFFDGLRLAGFGLCLVLMACATPDKTKSAEITPPKAVQPQKTIKPNRLKPTQTHTPKPRSASPKVHVQKPVTPMKIDQTRPYWVTAPHIKIYSTTRSIVGQVAFGTKLTIYDSEGVFLKIDPVQDHWVMYHQLSPQQPQENVGQFGLDKIPERNNIGWVDPTILENGHRE